MGRRFVDAVWVRHRIQAKDDRLSRAAARDARLKALAFCGTCGAVADGGGWCPRPTCAGSFEAADRAARE